MKNKFLLCCSVLFSLSFLVGCGGNSKIQLKIGFWPLSTDKEQKEEHNTEITNDEIESLKEKAKRLEKMFMKEGQ